MGVRRAMELVLTEANRRKDPLYTYGPLIHNHQVLDLLASKRVQSIETLENVKSGTIVIRAHGIPPATRKQIKETGLNVIDATCPKVAKVQALIRYHSKKGASTIIVGNQDHAEVIGLMGYSFTPVHVIQEEVDVAQLPNLDKVFVVAQTTQNELKYEKIIQALQKKYPDITIHHTICDATYSRQKEVRSLAGQVDALVVVGGYHSGNTRRLVQVSEELEIPTFHVETPKDLDKKSLSGMKIVGVTAGASTPNWMIKNVVSEIEAIRGKKETTVAVWFKRIFKFILVNHIGVSIGAFCFAYAATVLSERAFHHLFPFLTFLYIYAMHVLNRFLDKGAGAYNDPERSTFLKKHRLFLIFTGITAIVTGLFVSYFIGMKTLMVLCGLSLLGIMYSVPVIPEKVRHKYSYYKIKDIPGSRSLSEALAWVAIMALLPLLEMTIIHWPAIIICTLLVFAMSYVRSTLIDIFDVQGDLIVGTETLPIIIGEKRTLSFLKIILLTAAVMLGLCPILGLVSLFSVVMLIPVGLLYMCLMAFEKQWLYPGTSLMAMIEGVFLISGLLAFAWQVS